MQRRKRGRISPHRAKGRVALIKCDTGNRITAMVSLLMLADQASRHTNHNVTPPVSASNCPAQPTRASQAPRLATHPRRWDRESEIGLPYPNAGSSRGDRQRVRHVGSEANIGYAIRLANSE
jgi:hypothetical protein